MSIFSQVVPALLSAAVGSIFPDNDNQGSFIKQKQPDLTRVKDASLSHAERLRRLGGVYEGPKRVYPAGRMQQAMAMNRYLSLLSKTSQSNPYYSNYLKQSKGHIFMKGIEAIKDASSISEREESGLMATKPRSTFTTRS